MVVGEGGNLGMGAIFHQGVEMVAVFFLSRQGGGCFQQGVGMGGVFHQGVGMLAFFIRALGADF